VCVLNAFLKENEDSLLRECNNEMIINLETPGTAQSGEPVVRLMPGEVLMY